MKQGMHKLTYISSYENKYGGNIKVNFYLAVYTLHVSQLKFKTGFKFMLNRTGNNRI